MSRAPEPSRGRQRRKPRTKRKAASKRQLPKIWRATDVENARRLQRLTDGKLLHKSGLGFLVWDDRRWKRDQKKPREAAHHVGEMIRLEAKACGDDEIAKELRKHAKRAESSSGIDAMLKEVAVLPGVNADETDFDACPYKLNVLNGTIDLRTGKLEPHDKADHITKLVEIDYNPDAACPRWERFLKQIFLKDDELVAYIQWAAGYSLAGFTHHHIFFVLYGDGRNGKSTFLNTLHHVIGADYAQQLNPEVLLTKRNSQHPTAMAALAGVRFATAIETNQSRQLDEALIKTLTGGDPIRARFLYMNEFEFVPELKLWMATNHRPVIRDDSLGMWSRIRAIPFKATFEKGSERYDPNLKDVLVAEREGILAWAVRGIADNWQAEPELPAIVRAATDAYREEMDPIDKFLDDIVEKAAGKHVAKQELYEQFIDYTQCDFISKREFSRRLERRGYISGRGGGGTRMWKGICIREPKADDAKK